MWRLWSKPLELLGRFRLHIRIRRRVRVGDPRGADARGGEGWRAYLDVERLYDLWGPRPASPWAPYHCVPLFAAIDRLHREAVGPAPALPEGELPAGAPPPLPSHARPGAAAPTWLTSESWTILDLPGPRAVEAAVWLVGAAGCQPVCTFDNWPHDRGVHRAEAVLAELLRWATTLAEGRARINEHSPPLWICDADRLGERRGTPGEFDNRYYLDDSVLPGASVLRHAGLRRVVYVSAPGRPVPTPDLEGYFTDLLAAGLPVLHLVLDDPAAEPVPLASGRSRPKRMRGFRRSAAGGFGSEVPEPSSGSGS